MVNEREDILFGATGDTNVRLTSSDFEIAGNEFTAFYDGAHKLVFVLDKTVDARKPNVLLVINPIGDRKWDDILANDFGVDLETIRPKVDNKYQKLDIEYSGLSVYNRLIDDHNNGEDLETVLAQLSNFRTASVRRAATDRLAGANDTIEKSRETISKSGETIRELQSRLKELREKLAHHKKQIGKEPAKQSAAKILRTESQIEATNIKLRRAKKRLANAQRRMQVAEDDAAIARGILNQPENYIEINEEEPKAPQMVEEVKPLFDKDPNILDDKIAFKPIDFGTTFVEPEPVREIKETVFEPISDVPPAPLTFVSPFVDEVKIVEPAPAPVLETITTVSAPEPVVAPAPVIMPAPMPRPVSPISGPAVPVDLGERKRPNALYYIMLVVLIVLAIFTLWLYQKNTSTDIAPDLAKTTEPAGVVLTPAPKPAPTSKPTVVAPAPVIVESPFIPVEQAPAAPTVLEVEPAATVVAPEPEYYPPEPVAEPEPVAVPAPVVVNKPAFDVTGHHTFVADDGYATDRVVAPAPAPAEDVYYDDGAIADDGTNAQPMLDDQQMYDDGAQYDENGLVSETENYESYETYSE